MARRKRKLKQTKAAKLARRRYRAAKRKGKIPKRGCGKKNWRRGGNAYFKCKRGKKHPYSRRKRSSR